MPLDNLNNCTVTQYGPVVEEEGDSVFLQTLEIQEPPAGADYETSEHGIYYLVITADPEYRIRASQINISNEEAPIIFLEPVGTAFSEFGSGIYIYVASLGSTLPPYVEKVRIYDSLGSDYLNCDNQVIVQVTIGQDFSMPPNNVQMKINLNGSATLCNPTGGNGTYVPLGECEQYFNCGMGWNLDNHLCITNNPENENLGSGTGSTPNIRFYIAKYVEDEYNSKNNVFNRYYQGPEGAYSMDGDEFIGWNPHLAEPDPDIFHPNVSDQEDIDNQSCLGNSKPTCFVHEYVGEADWRGYFSDVGSTPGSTFVGTVHSPLSTTAGKILYHPRQITAGGVDMWYPNENNGNPNNDTSTTSWGVGFSSSESDSAFFYNNNFNSNLPLQGGPCKTHSYQVLRGAYFENHTNYLNTNAIYPGGDILPDKECWYVSIGGKNCFDTDSGHLELYSTSGTAQLNCDYRLHAEPEFFDVWGAVTILYKYGNTTYADQNYLDSANDVISNIGQLSSIPHVDIDTVNSPVPLDPNQYIYYEYTENDNQCDFDLANKTIEQIDNYTVKVCVPYRTDLVYSRSWQNDESVGATISAFSDVRVNKIFVNIHPGNWGTVDELSYILSNWEAYSNGTLVWDYNG